MTDYYKTLDIDKGATSEEIKKSYRKLALIYHPDKASSEQKEEYTKKFQEITEAYGVLSDEDKRKMYDMTGKADGESINVSDIFAQFFGNSFGNSFGNASFRSGTSFTNFSDNDNNPFSKFGGSKFFGGDPFGGQKSRNDSFMKKKLKKSPPLVHQVNLTLNDLFKGKVIKLKITKEVIFKGNEKVKTSDLENSWIKCDVCDGNGIVMTLQQVANFMAHVQRSCEKCSGTGNILKSEYEIKEQQEIVEIEIKKGMDLSHPHIIENAGHCSPGFLPGDIVIEFHLKPHPIFKVQNDDLILHKTILLSEALCGTTFEIEQLDNKLLEIKIDEIIKPGDSRTIKEAGMYDRFGIRGDLIIKFDIEFPESLLIHQKTNLKKYLPKRSH